MGFHGRGVLRSALQGLDVWRRRGTTARTGRGLKRLRRHARRDDPEHGARGAGASAGPAVLRVRRRAGRLRSAPWKPAPPRHRLLLRRSGGCPAPAAATSASTGGPPHSRYRNPDNGRSPCRAAPRMSSAARGSVSRPSPTTAGARRVRAALRRGRARLNAGARIASRPMDDDDQEQPGGQRPRHGPHQARRAGRDHGHQDRAVRSPHGRRRGPQSGLAVARRPHIWP